MDNWIESYCKGRKTCFLKNYVASLFTFYKKGRAICEFRF